jgi:hypothetical protein
VAAIAGVPVQACRCSKPYPITECRHPRPRQSAMLRNLSVLGIRSPMIVPSRNALTRLSQLARSRGDFAGLDVGKCESNQWSAPGSQL